MHDQTVNNLMLLALGAAIGVNVLFWSVVGLLRYLSESFLKAADTEEPVVLADVAVVIPAHNEETALPKCLRALQAVIPLSQVYVASDGSRDLTVAIARTAGGHVDDIRPNGGKANAIPGNSRQCFASLQSRSHSDADPNRPRVFHMALPLLRDPKFSNGAAIFCAFARHRGCLNDIHGLSHPALSVAPGGIPIRPQLEDRERKLHCPRLCQHVSHHGLAGN